MLKILKTYKKRLTNLTSGNRSLLLLKPFSRQFFDIHSLDFKANKPSFSIIEALIQSSKKIVLCDHIDPRDGKVNELSKQLKLVTKTNEMLRAERGAEDLYVGYPILMGKFTDGTLVRCPLAFFPVELSMDGKSWSMKKRDQGIALNRSFLLAYSHFNEIKVSDELLETNLEDLGEEARPFLTALYELLKQSELELNFNSDLFTDKLQEFKSLKRSAFDSLKDGELKLYPEAVLGIFPQAGSYISSDYDYLIENGFAEDFESIEEFLGSHQQDEVTVKEEDLRLPLTVDASQEEAIRYIKSGKSMVIQGPPGTGKSQLIGNLMADYAAQGKRVLLVCQKRAAIDTVYQRLSEVGIQAFVALIHDFKGDRKQLYKKISDQIDNILIYKHENQSLNSIFLEREFDAACRKIDKIVEELQNFKTALFDDSAYGKSIKELYLLANQEKEKKLDLKDSFAFFHFSTLPDYLSKVDTLEKYRDEFEDSSSTSWFWKNRKDFSKFSTAQYQEIKETINQLASVKEGLAKIDAPFYLLVDNDLRLIEKYEQSIHSENAFYHFQKNHSDSDYLDQLLNIKQELESLELSDKAILFENPENEIDAIELAKEKTDGFFKRIVWKSFSKDREHIYALSNIFDVRGQKNEVLRLSEKVQELIQFRERCTEIGLSTPLPVKSEALEAIENQISFCHLYHEFITQAPFSKRFLDTRRKDDFDDFVDAWKSELSRINENKTTWQTFLSSIQIETVLPENRNDLNAFLDKQFDNIQARDALYEKLTAVEKKCYQLTLDQFDKDFSKNFKQNLILHLIDDLEQKNPILRQVSSMQMQLWEDELQELIMKKRKFSQEHLTLKLREHTYKNIEKNRLGNTTTYRDLKHQTGKKRQIWPVRKVVGEFSQELFDLVPCWMASPETVSAIFPIHGEPLFDLVIFDEASQCFAENGFPAMLRGKQIVIAGDEKQLRPNDLYKVRFEEDSEHNILFEVESLLELAAQFLPSKMLQGHYRSKSLDLIDFSNSKFYKNRLKLLPDFKELNEGEPAIGFIKVDGVWENKQNILEARRVLELIRIIRVNGSDKVIGVVTFNYQQAELISEILIDYPRVIVKNIENIQGDEFDVVIFSIGYAPDPNGQLKMSFGSLSQKGGENRLNVAITRAKEKIWVVSSIDPSDLKVDATLNDGPKLLKEYLEYAQKVSEKEFVPSPPQVRSHSWSKQLKAELIALKPELTSELPFSDLAFKTENSFGDLVLTDDELFYSAESIKESYGYSPLTMKAKGWNYHRTWSRNWWQKVKLPSVLLSEEKATTE